jgi:hypothetical protein
MDQEQEFTVQDRRSAASERRPEEQPKNQAERNAAPGSAHEETGTVHDQGPGLELDFAAFVISLAGTAQMSLGLIPHPETNLAVQNIPAAKQLIDILGMLQGKTKGNLNMDEETLLEQILHNLRMHYVRVAEGQKKSGGS